MTDRYVVARQYLAAAQPSFWRWADGGDAIVWPDGATLAFRTQLAQTLACMAGDGLPQLGAVLLLLATDKESWRHGQSARRHLGEVVSALARSEQYVPDEWVPEVIVGLQAVREARQALADNPQALYELPGLVIGADQRVTSAAEAQMIVEVLSAPIPEGLLRTHEEGAFDTFLKTIKCLRTALTDVDPTTLQQEAATGIPGEVQAAEIELPPQAGARQLITELRSDEQYAGLARVARDLMGAILIPRRMDQLDNLPLGGVSDITNRGSLDRLLVSELAQDDEMLSLRVAMNEALYLRREEPPARPSHSRCLLLDTGVRMWGIPRVMGVAVALALSATTEAGVNLRAFAAADDEIDTVDLSNRAGMEAQLARIEPDLDAAGALDAYAEEFATNEHGEAVIITSFDAMDDPDFQRALHEFVAPLTYVVAVDREGHVELMSIGQLGVKRISQVTLNVDDLVRSPRPLLRPDIDSQLPAILGLERLPLRVPHPITSKKSWFVPAAPTQRDRGVLLSLTGDRRLTLWADHQRGPVQVSDTLPPGNLLWASSQSGQEAHAIVGRVDSSRYTTPRLLTIDLRSELVLDLELEIDAGERKPVLGAFSMRGHIMIVRAGEILVFDEESGRQVGRSVIRRKLNHQHGRFFSSGKYNWYFAVFDGTEVQLEPVLGWDNQEPIIAAFETSRIDGPIALTGRGEFVFTGSGARKRLQLGPGETQQQIWVKGISRDGRVIVVEAPDSWRGSCRAVRITDDQNITVSPCGSSYEPIMDYTQRLRARAIRHRFKSATIIDHHLVLVSRKGNPVRLHLTPDPTNPTQLKVESLNPAILKGAEMVPFKPIPGPADTGYELKAATWPNGSRVVVDSRGMVHLQNADSFVPEATLVLDEHNISGWVADGRTWGDAYFVDNPEESPATIYEQVIAPFVRGVT